MRDETTQHTGQAAPLHIFWNWVPVLMFHEVVRDGTYPVPPYAVTQSRLREILLDFTRRGYRSGTLEDAMAAFSSNEQRRGIQGSSQKRVVLTFDDGTRDFVEYALPVLREFNFSATLFIVTGLIGSARLWHSLAGQAPLTPVPLMNAEELRGVRDMGFTLGSHTVSHRPLTILTPDEAREEIALSRHTLSEILSQPVRWLAYPYLASNHLTQTLTREAEYEGACGGPNQKHSPFYLNRIDATAFTNRELRLRCSGLFHLARQTARQLRQQSRPSRASL
ncbi:MAG: polysaccharide deacetylase family protein [Chloroflexi bacterium]|nr:polysaccharide deacetylase family protein [Chloroflexota bacterium]